MALSTSKNSLTLLVRVMDELVSNDLTEKLSECCAQFVYDLSACRRRASDGKVNKKEARDQTRNQEDFGNWREQTNEQISKFDK